MSRTRSRRLFSAAVSLAAWLAVSVAAHGAAVPYEGMGQAPATAAGKTPARRAALMRAREAALSEALGTIRVPMDETARKDVLSRVETWTGAYRILDEANDGATITVKVEVEIDLARLRKRVAAVKAGPAQRGFRVGEVRGSGACKAIDTARVIRTLEAFGLASDDASARPLGIFVDCRELGPVPFTHAHASRAEVRARDAGGELAFVSSPGFAADAHGATEVAIDDALARLAEDLTPRAKGGVSLRVEKAWPAARVRRIERALREAVLGVTGVELVGLEADGTARLHVQGNVDPAGLAEGLRAVELPGFALTGFRVDSPHALSVRIVE